MHKLFVPYGIALELQKHGFDGPCFLVYREKKLAEAIDARPFPLAVLKNSELGEDGTVAVPLFQQVVDWLRETHKILISPFSKKSESGENIYWIDVEYMDKEEAETIHCDKDYYKAMIKVILILLKELKKK